MSDREKLIELLGEFNLFPSKMKNVWMAAAIEKLADHLISNGVTVGVDTKPLKQYLTQIDEYAGLKLKFLVFKADTGERIENCFVLRPDKDHAAVEALRAYAEATDNKTLADDIYNWVGNGATAQNWIPVSERLPEEDGLYITFGCTAVPVRWLHNFDKDMRKFGVWWNYEPDGKEHPRYRFIEADSITHWMPMPLPPKECE